MNIIDISYPTWSIALIVVIALLLAGILYYRNTFEDKKPLTIVLYILRTLGILLILFLLLNPFLSRSQNEEQKARLIFLQDNSESLFKDQDSQLLLNYQKTLQSFLEEENKSHPVDAYAFDHDIHAFSPLDAKYDGKITNISQALKYADDMHHSDHVGAMVIATDGIYNRGANPAYFKARGNYPVFVLAMGDTTQSEDVRIQQVLYNEIVRKQETSEIQVDITGRFNQRDAAQVVLQMRSGNTWKNIETKSLQPGENKDFFETIALQNKYETPGIIRMRVVITGIRNDSHPQNNVREFFVEVLETARKIAIVSTFPHPDIGAMSNVLKENDNNEVEVIIAERPTDLPDFSDFNVLIFYQPPAVPYLIDFIRKAKDQEKGIILTAGLKTNYSAFNELQNVISISPKTPSPNLISTRVNPQFDLFEVDKDFQDYIGKYPPLTGIFGEYNITGPGQSLFLQQIGDISTPYPVIFAGMQDGNRIGIITVEGFWKWKLFEYLEKQETPVFNELLDKVVEYVSQKKDDRLFRLQKTKLLFDETEDITFQAELYNETLERITEPDVFFELQDTSGNKSEYTFDKTSSGYRLNMGRLTPGSYVYRAHTSTGGQSYSESGQFSVRKIDLEAYNLVANHQDLNTIALQNNGRVFYDFTTLQEAISDLPNMKPMLIQSHIKSAMIDWKWIFGLILLVFTTEWFLRRYFGSY